GGCADERSLLDGWSSVRRGNDCPRVQQVPRDRLASPSGYGTTKGGGERWPTHAPLAVPHLIRPDPHDPQGSGDAERESTGDGVGQGVVQPLATLADCGLGHTEWDRSNEPTGALWSSP